MNREEAEREHERRNLEANLSYSDALVIWALAVEVQQAKEEILTTLDEAVTRIQTDIANVLDALANLRAEIAAAGDSGADVTKLNTAAQQMEDALSNVGPTLGQVSTPPATTDTGTTDTGNTADNTDTGNTTTGVTGNTATP